jgi:uncharacterized phage-associated protein
MTSWLEPREAVQILLQRASDHGWRSLNKLQITKLLYFIDLESVAQFEHPATTIDWGWRDHGPWDESIYDAFSELESDGIIKPLPIEPGPYPEHRYTTARRDEWSTQFDALIDSVIEENFKLSGNALKEKAYASPPMKIAQHGGARGVDLDLYTGSTVAHEELLFEMIAKKPVPAGKHPVGSARRLINARRATA